MSFPELTTDQVRDGFARDPEAEYHDPVGYPQWERHLRVVFDAWLAGVRREAKAEALEEMGRDANQAFVDQQQGIGHARVRVELLFERAATYREGNE